MKENAMEQPDLPARRTQAILGIVLGALMQDPQFRERLRTTASMAAAQENIRLSPVEQEAALQLLDLLEGWARRGGEGG